MTVDLILGTAGHIDHGKTALVKALTGIDTDRLPEEIRRGITIDLGFAELPLGEFRLGIVDVPGHERFIRNMLAGATGIDLALLVVAADESIKPQTREHLEILRLLQLSVGVIALSKCDLVDNAWIEMVEEDLRCLITGTFLADSAIIRTSAVTGLGLDVLKAALTDAARKAAALPQRHCSGPFRMAIDRSFTVAGHGTVVTGSVLGGRTCVGEELAIEPGAVRVRVRGLENHGRKVEEVHRGQRAAVNLAGVHHEQIARGQELAAVGYLMPSTLLSVQLEMLSSASRPLKHRSRVRLHVGAAELTATVALLEGDLLEPGKTAFAQLFLNQPAVTTWGQPFVFRAESPAVTIGGGKVLDPHARKLRRGDEYLLEKLRQLTSDDAQVRALAALYLIGWRSCGPSDLARAAGVEQADVLSQILGERGELKEISISPGRTIGLHRELLEELAQDIEIVLKKLHGQYPLQAGFERARLAGRFSYLSKEPGLSDAVFNSVVDEMAVAGRIILTNNEIGLRGCGPQLSAQQRELLEQLTEIYRQSGFQPPTLREVKEKITRNQAAVPELLRLAVAEGRLLAVAPDLHLHVDQEHQMRETLAKAFSVSPGLTVSQIRELLGTTRKYAIPFCEYLDRIGFTRRQGDLRILCGK